MNEEDRWRNLSVLRNPLIRSEEDLERITGLVDCRNFNWGSILEGDYCPSGSAGIYWLLRSLGESVGIEQDLRFCDIGFGQGEVLAAFAILGYKTYGIDKNEQPMKHAPEFFDRVQARFGRFRHQPQLVHGRIETGKTANFVFSDNVSLSQMDLYYEYLNEDSSTLPELIRCIRPKIGSLACAPIGYFHPAEYASLGFTLVNGNKKKVNEPDRGYDEKDIGFMEEAYRPIFRKEL
jgi:hypothetical protein